VIRIRYSVSTMPVRQKHNAKAAIVMNASIWTMLVNTVASKKYHLRTEFFLLALRQMPPSCCPGALSCDTMTPPLGSRTCRPRPSPASRCRRWRVRPRCSR
jgi:hypothetical protein